MYSYNEQKRMDTANKLLKQLIQFRTYKKQSKFKLLKIFEIVKTTLSQNISIKYVFNLLNSIRYPTHQLNDLSCSLFIAP